MPAFTMNQIKTFILPWAAVTVFLRCVDVIIVWSNAGQDVRSMVCLPLCVERTNNSLGRPLALLGDGHTKRRVGGGRFLAAKPAAGGCNTTPD